MALPQACSVCAFFTAAQQCHRHGPSPSEEKLAFVEWPKVPAEARCGAGAVGAPDEPPLLVRCEYCIHWLQPSGQPVKPDYARSRSLEWWARSGYCTRFAPSPSSEKGRKVFWKVTHAEDCCGDGEDVSQE